MLNDCTYKYYNVGPKSCILIDSLTAENGAKQDSAICWGRHRWAEGLCKNKWEGKRSRVEDNIRHILRSGLYLVQDGNDITLPEMKSAMQRVRRCRAAKGSFRILMDVTGYDLMWVFVTLCKEICTQPFRLDNERNVAVAFLKSGYVECDFSRRCQKIWGRNLRSNAKVP